MDTITLNNGVKMPLTGFGVFQIQDQAQCEQCVVDAVHAGYDQKCREYVRYGIGRTF